MKTSVLELSNLIQGFQLSCQTEGKSPVTVEWHTSFLERFRRGEGRGAVILLILYSLYTD